MENDERIAELEREVQRLDRTIVGLQQNLIRAANYKNDNPRTLIEGIQVLLRKAGEYTDNRKRRR